MRRLLFSFLVLAVAGVVRAEPLRVAVLDFENHASVSSDTALVGGVDPKSIADKGVYILGSVLANTDGFRLIDRRDFIGRIQSVQDVTSGKEGKIRPSFLKAAQALNVDLVLRGSLLSFSPGKQIVNQGGYKTELVTLSLRIALHALDTRDGTVVAAVDSAATRQIRQTDALQTVLGDDELTELLKTAIESAMPQLDKLMRKRADQIKEQPKIKLTVTTSADPALVELNGVLIGTTPLMSFEVYKGDHVLTVGKAGYRDVNQKIMLESDVTINIPMLRTELTADELKEVLKTMRMNVILGVPDPAIIINTPAQ